jgi:hypothetical protein
MSVVKININLINSQSGKTFWRVRHDAELPKGIWRVGMPEVHPLFPNHHSPFQKWAQFVSFEMNPWFALLRDRWRDMYHWRYAFANNQGFGIPDDPRADFINNQNTTKELPRVEALVSGGSMIEGERNGDWVRVKGLHFNAPITFEFLMANPQFWTRGIYAGGTGQPFRMLGDKYDGPAFIHPLIVNKDKGDLHIEAYKLQQWTSPLPPDPLRLYE